MIAKRNVNMLITIGKKAEEIADKDGTNAEVHIFSDLTGVFDLLKPKLDQDTIVFIKGPMSS